MTADLPHLPRIFAAGERYPEQMMEYDQGEPAVVTFLCRCTMTMRDGVVILRRGEPGSGAVLDGSKLARESVLQFVPPLHMDPTPR